MVFHAYLGTFLFSVQVVRGFLTLLGVFRLVSEAPEVGSLPVPESMGLKLTPEIPFPAQPQYSLHYPSNATFALRSLFLSTIPNISLNLGAQNLDLAPQPILMKGLS